MKGYITKKSQKCQKTARDRSSKSKPPQLNKLWRQNTAFITDLTTKAKLSLEL